MRKIIPSILLLSAIIISPVIIRAQVSAGEAPGKVVYLTSEEFKSKVFNWEKNPKTWVFEGKTPCVVDFYADWCKPCKMIAPIMEELAAKYKGKVTIYKVNTDKEKAVASAFGIRSIPSVLFCPKTGDPQMSTGALTKENYEQVIDEKLLGKKKSN
ncbi:MAG: thioredoxin [Bacteroidales bacterium]|jgi:thioredoxin|nr:thioredoxin [Bacteroidales bacterium]